MANSMTPFVEGMTAAQTEKLFEVLWAQIRKHHNALPANIVQQVLGLPELGAQLLAVLIGHIEMIANTIIRRVSVNRKRTPAEAIKATGRRQYVNETVVARMPQGNDEEVEVCFFKLDLSQRGRYISNKDLAEEYKIHGLVPDPMAQAAVNELDPAFADANPNAVLWQDVDGNWCYAAFRRFGGERYVDVDRDEDDWHVSYLFGGVRKSFSN